MIDISAEEFKSRLPELQIVDIRTEAEVQDFDLGGVHLPFDELLEKLNEVDFLRNQEFVIICYTGLQSKIAATILRKRGFEGVRNLTGGLEAFLSI
ncbi:rhodanese-like domain-containing protein [Flectobacillus sp. DC10W]|jgi:adenylyltransferase/sulfurtransferase|uniref:Rhodanese-like domain-containing protein n=1 Tax=Flectobacillus longus TaxID=2984207 RepID=A0ABT6YNH2_9BACT|nr:rhodanese-like domain-containing protein [Flectobacillus longus]MDI9865124.1 rhodanese-like domain-containing protein [Flectobacillus longus]